MGQFQRVRVSTLEWVIFFIKFAIKTKSIFVQVTKIFGFEFSDMFLILVVVKNGAAMALVTTYTRTDLMGSICGLEDDLHKWFLLSRSLSLKKVLNHSISKTYTSIILF